MDALRQWEGFDNPVVMYPFKLFFLLGVY